MLKVRGRIVKKIEKLKPSLKAGGSTKCHRTISAPCAVRADRKSPVQMLSGMWRGEAALFDLSNEQGQSGTQAVPGTAMARSGHCFSKGSTLKESA